MTNKKITLATYAILESINSPLLAKDSQENIQLASFIPTLYILANGYQAGLENDFWKNSIEWFDKQDMTLADIQANLKDAAEKLSKLLGVPAEDTISKETDDKPAEVKPADVSQPLCAGVPNFKPSYQ